MSPSMTAARIGYGSKKGKQLPSKRSIRLLLRYSQGDRTTSRQEQKKRANTHYAMLTEENPDLQQVNARAAFVVADGAPLVWAARH